MSDISTKLTYLDTTKQLLKTEINKINNVLDDNSTFRSYPQELFNGYLDILNNGTDTLWNNLEKVSASGEEATLENVETAPMKMVLSGNTSQETTTGKNIFNVPEEYLVVSNISSVPTNIEIGRYIISVDSIITDGTADTSSIIFYYEDGTTYATIYLNNTNKSRTLNFTKKVTKYNIYSQSSWAASQGVTATFNKLMIRSQSITDDSYEPYTGGQPSPSPDYPQQVKVVKGENVVSVSGKNKFNINDITTNLVTLTGTEDNFNLKYLYPNNIVDILTNFESGKQYAFSGYFSSLKANGGLRVVYSDDTKTYLFSGWDDKERNKTPFNFVSEASKNIVSLQIILYSNADFTIENFQIEENSQATPYVPYSKTDYPINLGDIELCKIRNYKDYLFKRNGKWFKHSEIGKVVLDGSEENWFQSGNYFRIQISNSKSGTNCRSNYFVAGNQDNQFFVYADNYLGFRYGVLNNILADWKTWLSTHNTIVYYVLATPTETEITNSTLIEQLEAISKAKSVKDKTYITQTNEELPFILDVEAIKEYEVN